MEEKQFGADYSVDHNRDSLGRGSFGEVKVGRTTTGRQVAVKIATDDSKIRAAKKEIEFLMKFLDDDHIVKLIGSKCTKDRTGRHPPHLTFAMELADCSLDKLMRDGGNIRGLPQDVLTDLVMDCCSAMKSLRDKNTAHRDIKHLNILVFRCKQRSRKSTYLFKFCDLGNASNMLDDSGMNSLVGTPNVLHPKLSRENAKGSFKKWQVDTPYTADECDLWSLACTLYFAASGHYPFPHMPHDASIYDQAVSTCPEDCISASIVEGQRPVQFRFHREIENQRYPKWFRAAFSTLIRTLLHHPQIDTYEKIAQALVTSKEYTFLSLAQLDVVKYADVTAEPLLRERHPSLRKVLEIPEGVTCRLFGDDDNEPHWLRDGLKGLEAKYSYLVLPMREQISTSPKTWKTVAQPERFENLKLREEFMEIRFSSIGEGFLALYDSDKMFTLFSTGKDILRQHLKRLRQQIISVKDSVAYPLRFATYANCNCQAWFVQSEKEKEIAMEGMRRSVSATNELSRAANELDKLVSDVDSILQWLERLELNERELPGMEADLVRYAFCDSFHTGSYLEDVKASTVYMRELIQTCYNRRTAIGDEFCGKAGDKKTDIRANMLQGLSRVEHMTSELNKLRNGVQDCAAMIELPFQEMKRRVEVANSQRNITERDLRRSMAFHNGPSRISSSAAELQALAKSLKEKLDLTNRQLQED